MTIQRPERGYQVWCQGGPADGFRYETGIEPPQEIRVMADPYREGWIRVLGDWPQAIPYLRVQAVEQIDGECIYYPRGEHTREVPTSHD